MGKWFLPFVKRKNSGAWGRWEASLLATEAFSWANLQREETKSTPDKFLTFLRKARFNQKNQNLTALESNPKQVTWNPILCNRPHSQESVLRNAVSILVSLARAQQPSVQRSGLPLPKSPLPSSARQEKRRTNQALAPLPSCPMQNKAIKGPGRRGWSSKGLHVIRPVNADRADMAPMPCCVQGQMLQKAT